MAKTTGSAIRRLGQLWLLLLAGAGLSQQATLREAASGEYYTAAVAEFRHAMGPDSGLNLMDNLDGYLKLINSPEASPADIIVFPEMTLNEVSSATYVPAAEQRATPCLDDPAGQYYGPFFVNISCAARATRKYVVININEKQLCPERPEDTRPCASTGHNMFNTNVVFDRNGTVVSKYRKVHLYLNEAKNTTLQPELVTFETDFNVTFGHLICFDIAFYEPANALAELQGIRDFVYPIKWHSQLPFYTAAQVHMGWAYGNDVNLLAAGASRVEYGSTGSGIYSGRAGSLVSVMKLDEGERRLYVARVPKLPRAPPRQQPRAPVERPRRIRQPVPEPQSRASSSGFVMTRDYLEQYTSVLLSQREAGNASQEVCHKQLCCRFQLEWTASGSSASYRLAAYDGWRNQPNVEPNYVRNCGVFTCTGPSIDDCGYMLAAGQLRVNLTRLVIEAIYPRSHEFLLAPNSVRDSLLPLEPAQFEWSARDANKGNQVSVRFALAEPASVPDLWAFGIFGNYYDDVCTFGTGSAEEDRQCGYTPAGDGAVQLRGLGVWPLLLLAAALVQSRGKGGF